MTWVVDELVKMLGNGSDGIGPMIGWFGIYVIIPSELPTRRTHNATLELGGEIVRVYAEYNDGKGSDGYRDGGGLEHWTRIRSNRV
jgi:hypothetical protein